MKISVDGAERFDNLNAEAPCTCPMCGTIVDLDDMEFLRSREYRGVGVCTWCYEDAQLED